MESREAPHTGAGETGAVTTVPFEVVRRAEFVFEPFVGSLIQLPETGPQQAQSSEFFLPQSRVVVGAALAEEAPSAEPFEVPATEVGLSAAALEDEQESRSTKTAKEEEAPRFFTPQPVRFFDPVAATGEQNGSKAADSAEPMGPRPSIQLSPELKAAILGIDEERRQRQEKKEEPAKVEKRGLRKPPPEKSAEEERIWDDASVHEIAAAERTARWEEVAAPAMTEAEKAAALPLDETVSGAAPGVGTKRTDLPPPQFDAVFPRASRVEEPAVGEEEKPVKKKEKISLATRLQRWLGGVVPAADGNRRRADRMMMPGLVAFYWSGGTPKPHEIVNISRTGFYLKTTEFWAVETLVRMTLQRPGSDGGKRKRESLSVLARVVRIDEAGVGHEFVTTEALRSSRSLDVMPSQGTNWRELDRFLGSE